MSALRHQATYHRAALLLGLEQGEDVVEWAEGLIAGSDNAPHDVIEVAMTPAGDLSAMRHALYPLCEAHETPDVVHELLAAVRRDLDLGRRGMADTVTLLGQLRSMVATTPDVHDAIKHFQIEYHSAVHGLGGSADDVGARIRRWLGVTGANHDASPGSGAGAV
jgi:hypothetical protein